jgi:hypothetical protein
VLQTSSESYHKNHRKKNKNVHCKLGLQPTQKNQKNNVVLQVSSTTFKNTNKWMQPSYNANDNDNLKKEKKGTTMFHYKI